jgi:hypothetical protein
MIAQSFIHELTARFARDAECAEGFFFYLSAEKSERLKYKLFGQQERNLY